MRADTKPGKSKRGPAGRKPAKRRSRRLPTGPLGDTSVEIRERQILIDGRPELIFSAEIHYFRLQRSDWTHRLGLVREAGCNAVASYIPWLCHETERGCVDLTGSTRPELDLAGFIDLCGEMGLMFLARPGPFVMAELKNEGLPYWLLEAHPEIGPITWSGAPGAHYTVDYLAPAFLAEVRRWYSEVATVLAPRTRPRGGNVIGLQLDNEIGMLSWVNNSPELGDRSLAELVTWLRETYEPEELSRRYPIDLADPVEAYAEIRSPRAELALSLNQDLGRFMRRRLALYVATLRRFAEDFGVRDIPFIVNLHGCGGGRGLTLPIGISQLYESYAGLPGYLSGSDLYLNNLTMDNFQDLYIVNALMEAMHDSDQPITSMEFQCGDGNYGQTFGNRIDPSSVDFALRICLAQGARWINYYTFSGGHNYRLDPAPDDGNGRIAHTGERHGFAAPISPEGTLNYTYPRLASVTLAMRAVGHKLASMREERDRIALGFIPDYYMTEYHPPNDVAVLGVVADLEANRGRGAWELMCRAMLLAGYRFGALDIQNRPLSVGDTPNLVLGSARYMAAAIQEKLCSWLRTGGRLLLYGDLPRFDMEGRPCTLLADAIGVRSAGSIRTSSEYFLSVAAASWARPRPEVRVDYAHLFEGAAVEPIFTVADTGAMCGFEARVRAGRAIVVATSYICDIELYRTALERIGAVAGLRHDCRDHGIFMTSAVNPAAERFVHVMNLDGFDKEFRIFLDGRPLFDDRPLRLSSRSALMLPVGVRLGPAEITRSTAEIRGIGANHIEFRLTQPRDHILLATDRKLLPGADYQVEACGDGMRVTSLKDARTDDRLVLQFA
ncbi:MAG TPA: beta-galactosidase [Geminicoccaceae bacterium]|mgnify:FL=1|nr:beta-galactosidase [Geminicoccus sp.]HMU52801.1 beta-galactosidase [Geminicoccaceae bacterium]